MGLALVICKNMWKSTDNDSLELKRENKPQNWKMTCFKYFVIKVTLTKIPNRVLRPYSDFRIDWEVKTWANNLKLLVYLFTQTTKILSGLYSIKKSNIGRWGRVKCVKGIKYMADEGNLEKWQRQLGSSVNGLIEIGDKIYI